MADDRPFIKPTARGDGWRVAAWSLVFVAAYAGLRVVSHSLQTGRDVSMWNPAAGLIFVAGLFLGWRVAPAVFVAVLGEMAWHAYARHGGLPGPWSYWHAIVVTGTYVASGVVLRRWLKVDPALPNLRSATWLGVCALATPLPSALLSTLMHSRFQAISESQFRSAFFHYWAIAAIGILTVVPMATLVLRWKRSDGFAVALRGLASPANALELGLQGLAVAFSLWATFLWRGREFVHTYYMMILPLVWIIMRRGLVGAIVCMSVINTATMIIAKMLNVSDPKILDLQAFMMIASISSLLLGSLSDQRLAAESELAASEHRYRILFADAPQPMWVYDRQTLGFLDVNQMALMQYGYTRDEFLAMKITDIRPAEDAERLIESISEMPSSVRRSGVWVHRRKNGDLIEVEITSSPMRSIGPDARLVLARDITETRRAEAAREQAEASLREALSDLNTLLNNCPFGVVEMDRNFRITRWTGFAEKIFGWSAEEVVGKHPFEFPIIHSDDRGHVERVFDSLPTVGQKSVSSFNRNNTKDGRSISCEWINSVLVDGQGRPSKVLSLVTDVTARVKAQEDLRASEERLALVLKASNDGLWDWNMETGEIYWSPRYHDILGDPDQRLTPSFAEWERMVHPDDREKVLEHLNQHLEKKSQYDIEYRHLHRDGHYRWFRAKGQAVWNDQGRAVRMAGSLSDITDRRLAEELVLENAEKYRLLVETTDTGYLVIGLDGTVLDANQRYVQLSGHQSLDEILGRTPLEWTSPADTERNNTAIRLAGKQGSIRGFEVDYVDRSGRVTPVEINATVVASGQGPRMLCLIRDITERRRTQAAIAEWKARYETASAASRQLVYELDTDTDLVRWGAPCEPIFGLPADSLSTLGAWEARVHPDDLTTYQAARNAATAGDHRPNLEYRVRHADGTYITVEDTARLVPGDGGRGAQLVGFVTDVTERARAREELSRHARELARSNAELERFAYVASHDLQEPLRMVISFTQLLSQRYSGKLDSDADEFIAFAVEGAERMRRLIDDLLTYSRVSSGPRTLAPVSARAAAERALANLHASVTESGAVVRVENLPESILADSTHLTLVFQNLIGNAIKFRRPNTPPEVVVRGEAAASGWKISVSDNGIGIDPKHRDRVFHMFQRLNPRSQYAGNGIGLTICRRIVEDMGGQITFESTPQQGSTFSFTVPAAASPAPATPPNTLQEAGLTGG